MQIVILQYLTTVLGICTECINKPCGVGLFDATTIAYFCALCINRQRERASRPFSHLKHSKNYCILLCAPSNKTQTKLNYKGIKTTATSSAVILRWAKWVWPLGVHISVCVSVSVSVTGQQANSGAIYKCETKATLCKKRKVANEALSQSQ